MHLHRLAAALGAAGAVALSGAAVGHAQSGAIIPTNIPGIGIVAPPPPDLDPVTASPAERERYHLPPAPDANRAPEVYAKWRRAMSGLQHREAPVVEQLDLYHGPVRKTGDAQAVSENSVAATSTNWSGTSVVNGAFDPNGQAIIGEFVVPTAHQAFGACTGGWVYSSSWPGIDGNGSNDVLQAGTEADAYCNGTTQKTNYYAWIEWFPAASVKVSAPTIHAGDEVFIQVWSSSPTTGFAYFYNVSTQQAAQYSLTAPKRTTLKANSVEWIVEAPTLVGSGITALANYIGSPWISGYSWNYNSASPSYYYQGADPATGSAAGTLEAITMVDQSSNPISVPTIENYNFLWFKTAGSACAASGFVCNAD